MDLTCLVCRDTVRTLTGGEEDAQPVGGTLFTTYGHYGSGVFDPIISREQLGVVVCDPCMLLAADRQQVLSFKQRRQVLVEDEVSYWVPPGREGSDEPC